MPELAEVAYFAQRWAVGLGKPILGVHVNRKSRVFREDDPEALARALPGRPLISIRTHGKQMLFQLGQDLWLRGHLGMSGELSAQPSNYSPGRHDHLALMQKGLTLIYTDPRMFGCWRHERGPLPSSWRDLPPELASSDFTKELISQALNRHRRAPVKAVLLRQEIFPGVGNWMADEILWRARLGPARLAGSLSAKESAALWRKAREVCRDAMRVIAPNWAEPPDSWFFQHRWEEGGYCPRCGLGLRRSTIASRATAWCAACQG